jgi:putative PIN family toxin of toxin-antitoxin system
LRFVLDNNVLLSAAFFKNSVPDKAFDKAVAIGKLLHSSEVLTELIAVINRPKFDKYLSVADKIAFIRKYSSLAELVTITHSVTDCRDPKDNKLLELALSGQADCIVTGDKDLLVLHPFNNIPIITPSVFVNDY